MSKNYTHGGDIYSYYEKYGRYPVDFSSSLNPFNAPKAVHTAYEQAYNFSFAYPPYDYKDLRKAIAKKEDVDIKNICVSNGAGELIRYIPIVFKPKNALITAPAFSEYKKSLLESNVQEYVLKKENDFLIQDDFINSISGKSMIFLTNPDNPVGNIINLDFIEKIAEKCSEENCILVIDECFIDLSCGGKSAVPLMQKYNNIIIIKAFTKTFSFAGLRLGYALSNENIIDMIDNMLPEWRVSMTANMCGIAALQDKSFVNKSKEYIEKEKKYMLDNFKFFNFKIYGSKANYIFFYTDIFDLKCILEKYGILIRDCSNYQGLKKGYYRVAVKKHDDNEKLVKALRDIFNG